MPESVLEGLAKIRALDNGRVFQNWMETIRRSSSALELENYVSSYPLHSYTGHTGWLALSYLFWAMLDSEVCPSVELLAKTERAWLDSGLPDTGFNLSQKATAISDYLRVISQV